MTNPLPYAGAVLPQFPQPRSAPVFIGNFQQGGIVPETGLYPVQSGDEVIPKAQVPKGMKGVAKLHKGELVLPRSLQQQHYLGAYQGGGIINVGPTQPWSEEVPGGTSVPTMDPNLQKILGAIKKGQLQPAQAQPSTTPGPAPVPGKAGVVQPAAPPPGMQPGVAQRAGGPTFEQLLAMSTNQGNVAPGFGRISTGFPGWPGVSGPIGGGGISQYIQPGAPPPYQSSFSGRGEKSQYEAGQITSRLFGGLLAWRQRENDKKVEAAAKYGYDQTMGQLQPAAAGVDQTQAQTAQQSPMGTGSTMQRQAAGLGAPGTGAGANALQGASAQIQQAASQGRSQVAQMQAQQQQQTPPGMTAQQAATYNALLKDPDPKTQKLAAQYLKSVQNQEKKGAQMLAKAQLDPFSAEARGINLGIARAVAQQNAQAELEARQMTAEAAYMKARQAQLGPILAVKRQQMQDQSRMDVARLQAQTARDRTNQMTQVANARTQVAAQNADQKRLQGEYTTAARNLTTLGQEYGKVGADLNAAQANLQKINPIERWWGSQNYQAAQNRVNELQTQLQSITVRLNQAYSQMQSLESQWNTAGGTVTPGSEFNVDMTDINNIGAQSQPQEDPILQQILENMQPAQ
jgi:hypothetical protein